MSYGRAEPPGGAPAGAREARQGSITARDLRGDTRTRRRSAWSGVFFVGLLVLLIVGGVVVFLGPVYRNIAYDLASDNLQALRLPLVSEIIRDRLGPALTTPAGDDDTRIPFTVEAGQSLDTIGQNLTDAGFISEPLVFAYWAINRGLDDELQTGIFNLHRDMTPRAIADRLALPPDPLKEKVVLALREGLRLEQVTAYLESKTDLSMDVAEFYDLVQNPTQELREDYPALKEIPKGRSLEGFLGAGVFEVDFDIAPEALVRLLLADWQHDIGLDLIKQAREAGLDFYETVTLASLVERETGDDPERPQIAGVYLNRLDPDLNGTLILNADPTVIYAVDTMKLRQKELPTWPRFRFWTTVDQSLAKVKVSDDLLSYQTYTQPGLPDGPIASPSLPSLRAAIKPNRKQDYLFFYACPGSKTHVFAKTLEEQQQNIRSCKPVKD